MNKTDCKPWLADGLAWRRTGEFPRSQHAYDCVSAGQHVIAELRG